MAAEEEPVKSFSDLFDEGLEIFNSLSKNYEPTNSFPVQCLIKKSMHLLEDCTKLISLAGLYSSNEAIEEVPTSHIKYFLLPALLGTLSLKLCVTQRLEVVTTAEIYFRDFLSRCKMYGIIDFDLPDKEPEVGLDQPTTLDTLAHAKAFDLSKMAQQRSLKIQRFKEQKEMERQLAELQIAMDDLNVDDDIKRNYYLTLIKSFSSQAIDEVDCLVSEKEILVHRMSCESTEDPSHSKKTRQPPNLHPHKPLMPIIITRNEVQKQVFGAGYPSLPVMTVQQFYDQRVQSGEFPEATASKPQVLQEPVAEEKEETELEEKEEKDDPDLLQQRRGMDEHKDTHRRGWGNRANRS